MNETAPKIRVLNIDFDNITLEDAVRRVMAYTQAGKTAVVVTPNPEISEQCSHDPVLLQTVQSADMALPDGIGVIYASRILGRPLRGRVTGYDLSHALLPELAHAGKRLYLLGAKPGIAEAAAEKMRALTPGLMICGTHDGYFTDDDEAVEAINAARADVVFVALGSPRQELWMQSSREKLRPCVMLGLGGTLDGFAGTTRRAPAFFIRFNLEWFYRLLRQPWRFRRMLKLPRYILRAFAARLLHRDGGAPVKPEKEKYEGKA